MMIMSLGILSLAVITATVSSTFMDQARLARAARQLGMPDDGDTADRDDTDTTTDDGSNEEVVEDLVARLARIEALLEQQVGGSAAT